MHSFQTNQIVNHSADKMFELVADIEKYPNFVPLCQTLDIKGQNVGDDGITTMIADMTVAYKFIRETFTSRVILKPNERIIETEYLDGPFKHMENWWKFTDVTENKSEVEFFISYEFKSRILSTLMGTMFDKVFRKFSMAFSKRADEIYGCA